MQTLPNQTGVTALVLEKKPAEDGWGAWAEVKVQEVRGVHQEDWRSLLETPKLQVFVPPPLVARLEIGKRFVGHITFRSGTYSLVK